MGSTFSLQTRDQADESSQQNPFPEQRVGSSILYAPLQAVNSFTKPSVPSSMSVVKKRLGFMVRHESIHIKSSNGLLDLHMSYRSDHQAVLEVEYSTGPGNFTIYKATLLVPETRIIDGTDFQEFSVRAEVSDKILDLPIHLRLRIHNQDGSLDFVAKYKRGIVNIEAMSFESETGRIELLQLFNASTSSTSPSLPSSHQQKCCAVCLSNEASVGFLPCRHVCVCGECAHATMVTSSNHCPICRSVVTGTIKVD